MPIAKYPMLKKMNNLRHLVYAFFGAKKYGFPSKELRVIGITGTSGKSTTVYLLRQLLEYAGHTVGSLSTIDFSIAGENKLNDQKMTMLGRAKIQEYLREMVDKGCDIAIVETTSEGVVQHRHRFVEYDTAVITNLYPEHIESHGGFDNYKNAKKKLFSYTAGLARKVIHGKKIPKIAIVNRDMREYQEFTAYPFDAVQLYGEQDAPARDGSFQLSDVRVDRDGLHFTVNEYAFDVPMYGKHNAMNILACIAVARSLGISWQTIEEAVQAFHNVPGRIEFIEEAEDFGFRALVDFAFEPVALAGLYDVVDILKPKRVIHVGGATGGGRDASRRGPIGELVGKKADMVIVTDEDPYEEDPMAIMRAVADGAKRAGKKEKKDLFIIPDRKEAIAFAIRAAEPGDLVLVTGKGSEQAMCVAGGKKIPWDDREEVRRALKQKKRSV